MLRKILSPVTTVEGASNVVEVVFLNDLLPTGHWLLLVAYGLQEGEGVPAAPQAGARRTVMCSVVGPHRRAVAAQTCPRNTMPREHDGTQCPVPVTQAIAWSQTNAIPRMPTCPHAGGSRMVTGDCNSSVPDLGLAL